MAWRKEPERPPVGTVIEVLWKRHKGKCVPIRAHAAGAYSIEVQLPEGIVVLGRHEWREIRNANP